MLKPNTTSDRLHLGCGLTAPPDWLNVDGSVQAYFARWPRIKSVLVKTGMYPRRQAEIPWPTNILCLDLRKSLPFSEGRFVAVYSSHTFEHLFHDDAVVLAKECYRVLKKGGIFRVVVPDLAAFVEDYQKRSLQTIGSDSAADRLMEDLNVQPKSRPTGFLGLYHRLLGYHEHKWMYDAPSLRQLLLEAGFSDITHPLFQEGRLPGLQEIEKSSRVEKGAGVIAEGIKT